MATSGHNFNLYPMNDSPCLELLKAAAEDLALEAGGGGETPRKNSDSSGNSTSPAVEAVGSKSSSTDGKVGLTYENQAFENEETGPPGSKDGSLQKGEPAPMKTKSESTPLVVSIPCRLEVFNSPHLIFKLLDKLSCC